MIVDAFGTAIRLSLVLVRQVVLVIDVPEKGLFEVMVQDS